MRFHDITRLLGIKDEALMIHDITHHGHTVTVEVGRKVEPHICPKCHTSTMRVHDYRIRTIKHALYLGMEGIIHYRRRRYRCMQCETRFPERNMIADRYDKISTLSKQTLLDEYRSLQSFKSIAQRLHISSSTVMRHTRKYVVQPRLKLPEVLAIPHLRI